MKINVETDMKKMMVFLACAEELRDSVEAWEYVHGKLGNVARNPDEMLLADARSLVKVIDDMWHLD